MKIDTPVRAITIGGILTVLILLLQSAPAWLHGVGLLLSPLATLPIALAAILSIPLGAVVYIAAAFLLMIIIPQEAAIFLLGTGLLGLSLGVCHKKETLQRILIPATALFIGMVFLTKLALIPVFGALTPRSLGVELLVFLPFSLVYTGVWVVIISYAVPLMDRIRR